MTSERNTSLLTQAVILLAVLMDFATPTFAATSDFFSVTPEANPAHDDVELYKIFTTGVGTYDSTMEGKLYPYNLPQNGVTGRPSYNGCYDNRNKRLHDLDADNSCTTAIYQNPGISIIRIFLGYKVYCSDSTTSGTCQDMGLFMNCQLTQVQVGTGPFEGPVGVRYCSTGNPIIRRAKANASVVPLAVGCYPGQDGSKYPDCTPCPDGTYNDVIGANREKCTVCPVPTPTGVGTLKPVKMVTNITGGTTGAVSASQCMIADSDPWTCAATYAQTPDNQQCVAETAAAPCSLSLSLTPTNPSADNMNDGKIMATYSGASGSVSSFKITSPTAMNASTTAGSTATFDGLGHNTYTISVTDSVCTETASIALTAPTTTSCSACPTGSTASGNLCIIPNQTSCPSGFTLDATGTCTRACTTGTALGACSLTMTATTVNPPTLTGTGTINFQSSGSTGSITFDYLPFTGGAIVDYGTYGNIQNLKVGTYIVTATDTAIPGCKASVSSTLYSMPSASSIYKGMAKLCHALPGNLTGNMYTIDCWQTSSGTFASSSMFYAQQNADKSFVSCPSSEEKCPGAISCDPSAICSNDSLFTTINSPVVGTLPDCSTLTCSGGSLQLFMSASGVNAFTSSNPYTNSSPGNACKTSSGVDVLTVCSSGIPAVPTPFEACSYNSGASFYYRVAADPACK